MKKNNKDITSIQEKNYKLGEDESSLSNENKSLTIITDSQKKKIRLIRKASRFLDYIVLLMSIIALFVGLYAFWDTNQIMEIASSEKYAVYKPNSKENFTFDYLKKINPDVFGWIDIYGTNIDYPIVQGKDNWEYLNKTVLGEFSTAGSIFLDYRNRKDFSDFQNVLYGHFMAERKMFGDIELFKDESFFEDHKYGVIHKNGKESLGMEIFAFIKTVGSDQYILTPSKSKNEKKDLIDHIYKEATYSRKLDFTKNEKIIVLDTCDLSKTNGRYILLGRLTDKVEKNNFEEKVVKRNFSKMIKNVYKLNILIILIELWILLVMIYLVYEFIRRKRERTKLNV